jgi:chromosome segregation ATPase
MMTDKQDFEYKATLTYGHKLLTGKKTKYEFVKQDFDKDIDVPSKQIIIDGCDVSGCEHFEDEECLNPSETVANCEASPNCNYKQLKRLEKLLPDINGKFYKAMDDLKAKEQECESWKTLIDQAQIEQRKLEQQLDQLKFDNKILNSTISSLEETRDILVNKIDQLNAENERLEEQLELNTANAVVIDMVERLYKLKQTLTSIKEFVENEMTQNGDTYIILQKINEVENENNKN